MSTKERLTVTVDRNLLQAAHEAVAAGRADSLSAWVNRAVAERLEKERRLSAMAEAVAAYEKEFGVISEGEMAEQAPADHTSAAGLDFDLPEPLGAALLDVDVEGD